MKLKGFKELEKLLVSLGPDVARKGLRSANFAGTRVIRDAVKNQMGVGSAPKVRLGFLQAGVVAPRRRTPENVAKHSVVVKNLRVTKVIKRRKGKRAGKYSRAAGPAIYGRFLEFGTSKMRAHPFMTPAFFNNTDRAIAAIKQGLKKAILRAATAKLFKALP